MKSTGWLGDTRRTPAAGGEAATESIEVAQGDEIVLRMFLHTEMEGCAMSQGVYTGEERRQAVRYRFDAEVKLEHEDGSFEARGTDFNDESIRVVHSEALAVGTPVKLHVVDELGNNIVLEGEVARVGAAEESGFEEMVIKRT
jgi:imidazolonepropionase-like amidohydrolase